VAQRRLRDLGFLPVAAFLEVNCKKSNIYAVSLPGKRGKFQIVGKAKVIGKQRVYRS
jgi:hypothetical protein